VSARKMAAGKRSGMQREISSNLDSSKNENKLLFSILFVYMYVRMPSSPRTIGGRYCGQPRV